MNKTMKRYTVFLISMMLLMTLGANAKDKEKVFFNSKSNIIGVTGNYELLTIGGFTAKFVDNPIDMEMPYEGMSAMEMCEYFNNNDFGKKLLDYLFMYNGTSLSIELLADRAYNNAQKQDVERAEYGVVNKEAILKGDDAINEVLRNNFIFIDNQLTESKRKWFVFKVNITNETLKEVYNSWNDMAKYNQIHPKVVFVASSRYKVATGNSLLVKTNKPNNVYSGANSLYADIKNIVAESIQQQKVSNNGRRLIKNISKKVPEFAIRGQVISRSPFMTNVGKKNGIKNRDRMGIYRAKQDNEGRNYSSRVATVRACNLTSDNAYLYTFAGGQASAKQGDVAVFEPNHNSSYSVIGNYMNHSYGINLAYDHRLALSKAGFSQYLMTNIGCGVYDGFQKRLYVTNDNNLVHSPILFNVALGYGVGYEFAHCIELVPYFMAQYEGAYFKGKENKYVPKNESLIGSSDKTDVYANSVRIPVGVKAHINLFYPVQLVVGAEYIFNFNISLVNERNLDDPELFFYKPMNYKRDGLNMFAGLRFNF